MVLGQRADGKSIKKGSDKCAIEAIFDVSKYQLEPFFLSNDLEYDADRLYFAPGALALRQIPCLRHRFCFPYDLKELGSRLIDIHLQHQNLLLGDNRFQLKVIDVPTENEILLILYKKEFTRYQAREGN